MANRIKADKSLQHDALYSAFVRESRDGIIILDSTGHVVEWNKGEEIITGIPRSEAIGKPLWEIQYMLAPEEKRTSELMTLAREKILKGMQEGLGLERVIEDEIQRPDGTRRVIHSRIFSIRIKKQLFACGISRAASPGMGEDPGYIDNLKKALRLIPQPSYFRTEERPYPVKIYTFGGLSIFRDGRLKTFPGGEDQMPLRLLKAVVASGGKNVREDALCDLLWPDALGDAARASLKTNLYRLRQLIGHKEAVHVAGRRVALDGYHCWVDTWAFKDAVQKVDETLRYLERTPEKEEDRDGLVREFLTISEEALTLYKGDFLMTDEAAWIASPREKLREKFVQLVLKLCEFYENTWQWEKVIETCLRGLEAADLTEAFYQKLMKCYKYLGRTSDAVSAYRRCRTICASAGVRPSSGTESLYKSIRDEQP